MVKENVVFKDSYNRVLGLLAGLETLPTEPDLAARLGVSRTTVRAVLTELSRAGVIVWDRRVKRRARAVEASDYFEDSETQPRSAEIERALFARIETLEPGASAPLGELELARSVGTGTGPVREFLSAFAVTGLVEKRANSHWQLRPCDGAYVADLFEVREALEVPAAIVLARRPTSDPVWMLLDRIEAGHRRLGIAPAERRLELARVGEELRVLLTEAAGNRLVAALTGAIATILRLVRWLSGAPTDARVEAIRLEHLAFLDALAGGKAEAAADAWRRHLREERAAVLAGLAARREASLRPG